jgi:hypothetical protein
MRKKVTIVGAGRVGETLAPLLAQKALGDLVLVDVVPNLAQGKALDLMELRPLHGSDVRITGTTGYEETNGLGPGGRHLGHAAQAGREPRGPAAQEHRHREARGRGGEADLAPGLRHHGGQPARHHDLGRAQGDRLAA